MDVILPEDQVTTEALTAILEEGAISCRIDDDGDIYVTEFSSPYWIMIDKERKFLRFYTFIRPVSSDEAALLELVNRCNEKVVLIQFSYSKEHGRFVGSYQMPYRNGILRAHILRIARDFPGHFNHVLAHEDRDDLLIDGAYPGQMPVSDDERHMLN